MTTSLHVDEETKEDEIDMILEPGNNVWRERDLLDIDHVCV